MNFKQITAVAVTDTLTGKLIPVVYGVTGLGDVYRKVARQKWEKITEPEHFRKHEEEIS